MSTIDRAFTTNYKNLDPESTSIYKNTGKFYRHLERLLLANLPFTEKTADIAETFFRETFYEIVMLHHLTGEPKYKEMGKKLAPILMHQSFKKAAKKILDLSVKFSRGENFLQRIDNEAALDDSQPLDDLSNPLKGHPLYARVKAVLSRPQSGDIESDIERYIDSDIGQIKKYCLNLLFGELCTSLFFRSPSYGRGSIETKEEPNQFEQHVELSAKSQGSYKESLKVTKKNHLPLSNQFLKRRCGFYEIKCADLQPKIFSSKTYFERISRISMKAFKIVYVQSKLLDSDGILVLNIKATTTLPLIKKIKASIDEKKFKPKSEHANFFRSIKDLDEKKLFSLMAEFTMACQKALLSVEFTYPLNFKEIERSLIALSDLSNGIDIYINSQINCSTSQAEILQIVKKSMLFYELAMKYNNFHLAMAIFNAIDLDWLDNEEFTNFKKKAKAQFDLGHNCKAIRDLHNKTEMGFIPVAAIVAKDCESFSGVKKLADISPDEAKAKENPEAQKDLVNYYLKIQKVIGAVGFSIPKKSSSSFVSVILANVSLPNLLIPIECPTWFTAVELTNSQDELDTAESSEKLWKMLSPEAKQFQITQHLKDLCK